MAPRQTAQATHRTVKLGICGCLPPITYHPSTTHTPVILLALCLLLVTGLKSWFSPTWETFDK